MRFTKLPDSVIADIADRMDHSDVCNLMMTSKRVYNAIKLYKKDKIKLKRLQFENAHFVISAVDHSDKHYRYKNWNHMDENFLNAERVLQTCESVDWLNFPECFQSKDFAWYEMFMKTKVKIGNIDIEKMLNLGRKFRAAFHFRTVEDEVFSDEFLTKLLPRSTVIVQYGYGMMRYGFHPFPITDLTLNALVDGDQRQFSIHGMHNSITIEGIVRAFKVYREKYGAYLKPEEVLSDLDWDFGLLHPNQTADVEKYFGESGELRGICKRVRSGYLGLTLQYQICGDGFGIIFAFP